MKKAFNRILIIVTILILYYFVRLFGIDYKVFYYLHYKDFQCVADYMINNFQESRIYLSPEKYVFTNTLPEDANKSLKRIMTGINSPGIYYYTGHLGQLVFFDFNGSTAFAYSPKSNVQEVKSAVASIHDDYKTVAEMSEDWYYVTKIKAPSIGY